jgi:hypothetical protein
MNETSALIKEIAESPPCHMKTQQECAISELGSRPWADVESPAALILDF